MAVIKQNSDPERHYTCTGTSLGRLGGDVERVPVRDLESLYLRRFGYQMSNDPVVRIIQSEQVLARLARDDD